MADVGKIIEYESGEMSDRDTVELFAELIRTGDCWTLQGHYGRVASSLIENGLINKKGEIDQDALSTALGE